MFKYKKVLLFVNRAVYLLSAAMLMAGLALSASPQLARATAIDVCSNIPGNQDSIPTGMESDGSGKCVCQTGYVETGSGSSVYCILPTSTTPPDDQVCSHDGDWVKIDGLSSNSYTYTIPDGKQVVEVCYKAGNNTYTYSVIPPATGSISITNDQFENKEDKAYYDLSHASFRLQDKTTPPVTVNVCHVPDYTTEVMTEAAWTTLHALDQDDFLVDAAHPCTPPVVTVNVCHVPDYTTEEMTEGAWETLHATDQDDFLYDDTIPCAAPGTVNVCHVPDYTTEVMTEAEWATLHASDQDDFLYSLSEPCEPVIAYCHYDASENLWTQEQGYSSAISDPDYLLDQGETCPMKVPYCIYDAESDLYAEGTQYLEFITGPDIEMPESGSCPVKVEYCHYTSGGPYGETWTPLSTYPDLIIQPDFVLEAGEVCPQPTLILDPYCYSVPGDLMQWVIDNPNATTITIDSWKIDGFLQPGVLIAPSGTSLFTTTSLGTHTVDLYWGLTGHSSLEWTIDSCALPIKYVNVCHVPGYTTDVMSEDEWDSWQKTHASDFLVSSSQPCEIPPLPIPETGGAGGPIIPVTGADLTQPLNAWFFGGFGMFGFGMILTGLRKMLGL